MSFSKVILFLCVVSVLLRADWGSGDSQNLSTIQSDLMTVKDLTADFETSFIYYSNVTQQPIGSHGFASPWLLQMAYGVELNPRHVSGSNEHWDLQPNVPTDDYLTAFGLKGGYEDNTNNYLDFINRFGKYKFKNGYLDSGSSAEPIDNWLSYGAVSDVMNTLDSANFGGPSENVTQSAAISNAVKDSLYEADGFARGIRARLVAIANNSIGGSNYTGDVLQFNFSWLHGMLSNITNAISNNRWTFSAPWMLNNNYVFTLRPQQGNLLYPLYHAWYDKRSYIDIFVSFVCYFSVFAFIVSRVYAILTK